MLLAVTCPVCGAPGRAPCAGCASALVPAPALPRPVAVDACAALLAYEGAGRELVARLKYRNHRGALGGLARAMADLAAGLGPVDAVTWLPTTALRRRSRGFDQAELLARRVAHAIGRPATRLLARRPGPPQTGRSLTERRRGPVLVAARPSPRRVLLVDDVITSGASVTAAALVLRGAGASSVAVLAAARTPRSPRSPQGERSP